MRSSRKRLLATICRLRLVAAIPDVDRALSCRPDARTRAPATRRILAWVLALAPPTSSNSAPPSPAEPADPPLVRAGEGALLVEQPDSICSPAAAQLTLTVPPARSEPGMDGAGYDRPCRCLFRRVISTAV